MAQSPDNHETKPEMEEGGGGKSLGSPLLSALSLAQSIGNHHMQLGEGRVSSLPPTAVGPPIDDQESTIVRHQHVPDSAVNNDEAKEADDIREVLSPGLQYPSAPKPSSILPITHIIQRRASASASQGCNTGMADINRSASDARVNYRYLELNKAPAPAPATVTTDRPQQATSSAAAGTPQHTPFAPRPQQSGFVFQPSRVTYGPVYSSQIPQYHQPFATGPVLTLAGPINAARFYNSFSPQPLPFVPQPVLNPTSGMAAFLNPPGSMTNRGLASSNWRAPAAPSAPTSFATPMAPTYVNTPMVTQQPNVVFGRSTPYNRAPFRTRRSIGFHGYVPSSISLAHGIADRHHSPFLIEQERRRAERNLPVIFGEEEMEILPYYARWKGGFIEVNDDLIGRCICPADLLQYPCRWDEFRDGCTMVRLCSQLRKHNGYQCPDENNRGADVEGSEPAQCPHLHWEVEPSCRFIAVGRECEIITKKAFECSVGHDMEWGRIISRERFEHHVRDALMAGAKATVDSRTIILQSHHDRPMAWFPGPLPRPYT